MALSGTIESVYRTASGAGGRQVNPHLRDPFRIPATTTLFNLNRYTCVGLSPPADSDGSSA